MYETNLSAGPISAETAFMFTAAEGGWSWWSGDFRDAKSACSAIIAASWQPARSGRQGDRAEVADELSNEHVLGNDEAVYFVLTPAR